MCEWLRETGEGETLSPSAPPPMAIAITVHCMGTCSRKKIPYILHACPRAHRSVPPITRTGQRSQSGDFLQIVFPRKTIWAW
jgi:hypothetical protein